jgi:outer membrane lipoprotein SlyB
MHRKLCSAFIFAACCALTHASWADDTVKDAAIGGAIGGALGGAVGAEVGGKSGGIVGAGVGAAAGAAIATADDEDGHDHDAKPTSAVVVVPSSDKGKFCPPGQAKKGNC